MSLKISEQKWKTSLNSILDELDNSEYKKMLLNLDKIPKRRKTGKSREEMPQIIIQNYGLEESVLAIKKAMNLIPRKDAAVQDRLRPFVDKLKKKRQTKNKGKKESSEHNKTKTISDVKSSCQLLDTEAIVGKIVHKSDLRSYVTKNNETKAFFNLVVADKTASIKVMVYGKERLKEIRKRSCYMFKKVIVEGNIIKVTKLTTVLKTRAIKIPAKVQREAQMITDLKPASSKAQTSAQKLPVNVQGTVKGVQSDDVQSGRITIIRVIKSTKTKFHLEAEFNDKQQTLVVTSRRLAKAFGFKLEDDFKERLLGFMPVSTEAKIQGNKITEMKNL